MKAIYLGLVLALSANLANAEVYRWTDADGKVHYSQVKPNEKPDAESLDIRTKYKDTAKKDKDDTSPDKPKKEAKKEAEEDLSKLSPEELKRRNCNKAMAYQNSLQHKGEIAITGSDGKLQTLSEADREGKLKEAARLVQQHCAADEPEQE